MDNYLAHFTIRTDKSILHKIGHVASYEGITKQKLINKLIRDYIKDFETNNPDIYISTYKDKNF